MIEPLSNVRLRELKARAQHLEPVLRVGKAGVNDAFLKSVDEALNQHELIKIKFADFKDQKKELAPALAEKTSSQMVMRVGNVVVLYRRRPAASARSD